MKLLSFIHQGRETWGALVGPDSIVDLGKALPQFATLTDYIASGAYLNAQQDVANKTADVKLTDITFLPVIPKPEKIVCAVRNYMDHHKEVLAAGMQRELSDHWLLFIAEHEGRPIASSLIGIDRRQGVAYGRYWGALERVDCLHFEACYYQPLEWCIAQGFRRFEGGAQGEHKMARALLPVRTTSAHWLAHPAFADAVDRFLDREGQGIDQYLDHLAARSPLRQPGG